MSDAGGVLEVVADHACGDAVARYFRRRGEAGLSLALLPAARLGEVVGPRAFLDEPDVTGVRFLRDTSAWATDPLAHAALRGGDRGDGFAQGVTMRNHPCMAGARVTRHAAERLGEELVVTTELTLAAGLVLTHTLRHRGGDPFVRVGTAARNAGPAPLTLDLLTSFSLSGITAFAAGPAHGRLRLHRFRSAWSAEGRPVTDTLERLQLERSWTGSTVACERFGQAGSMPVRRWFPAAVVEDAEAGVCWGAQLDAAGSWQLEAYRRGDFLQLSGGPADREFGDWGVTLGPGERFDAPAATLTCCSDGRDAAAQRLVEAQRGHPGEGRPLDAVFNEWCTTWGRPTHAKLEAQADALKAHDVPWLVIDDGWQRGPERAGGGTQGDWDVDGEGFPRGLAAAADAVRARGLGVGLWMEFEVAMPGSAAFEGHAGAMLRLGGEVIRSSNRRFWDLRRPEVLDLVAGRVVHRLRDAGIGFLKVDYNGCLPPGVDGPAAPGENLRQHLEGAQELFRRVAAGVPGLLIENCASGGHRLTPAWQRLAAVGSATDCHEGTELPVIAANLHRLILPEQSLVWAVLRAGESERRTVYSLAATLLGRVCLSGDLTRWSPTQRARVDGLLALHRRAAGVIRRGVSRLRQPDPATAAYRDLRGVQVVERAGADATLVVVHRFGGDGEGGEVEVGLPPGHGVAGELLDPEAEVRVEETRVRIRLPRPFSAAALLLEAEAG